MSKLQITMNWSFYLPFLISFHKFIFFLLFFPKKGSKYIFIDITFKKNWPEIYVEEVWQFHYGTIFLLNHLF